MNNQWQEALWQQNHLHLPLPKRDLMGSLKQLHAQQLVTAEFLCMFCMVVLSIAWRRSNDAFFKCIQSCQLILVDVLHSPIQSWDWVLANSQDSLRLSWWQQAEHRWWPWRGNHRVFQLKIFFKVLFSISPEFYSNFCKRPIGIALGISILMTLCCSTLQSEITK